MRYAAALVLVLSPALALAQTYPNETYPTCSAFPLDASGGDLTDLDDQWQSAMTTDAAVSPAANAWGSKVPYPGVGAAQNAGGHLCAIPASGNNQLTGVTKAGTAGDTITITAIDLECVVTTTTITEGDGTGGTYECDGAATDAACVAALSVVLEAAEAAGKFGSTYTAASETLVIYSVPGTSLWVGAVASDGTNTAITQGADGQLMVSPGTAALPGLSTPGDPDTGITWPSANLVGFYGGGAARWVCGSSTGCVAGTLVDMQANYIYGSTAALDVGGACTPVGIANSAGNTCFSGEMYLADRMAQKVEALADGDATPDVSGANRFLTPSNTAPTVITDLDNPVAGQVVTICIGNATNPSTIADAGNFNLSAAWNPGVDDCISLLVQADNDYIELGRVDN